MRDPSREVPIRGGAPAETTTTAMAAELLGEVIRAIEAAVRLEIRARLEVTLEARDSLDHEVLALRHFEQRSQAETARVLGIKEKTAGMRYLRAVRRLKGILDGLGGEWLGP
jgi:RNA polymerase sigma-70 factor (ECF subfamily)